MISVTPQEGRRTSGLPGSCCCGTIASRNVSDHVTSKVILFHYAIRTDFLRERRSFTPPVSLYKKPVKAYFIFADIIVHAPDVYPGFFVFLRPKPSRS